MELRFHLDESVDPAVAAGLRRRGIDVTTTQEAGLLGVPDHEQLSHAAAERRVLVTHDEDFLALNARGAEHTGIAFAHPQRATIGRMVLALTALWRDETAESMRGQLRFL